MNRFDKLPVRWRLAITSAGLTFVILMLFAILVEVVTVGRMRSDFDNDLRASAQQLSDHICINLRLPTRGGLYAWEFEKAGRVLNVRVEGQLVLNTAGLIRKAALAGAGLACLPQNGVQAEIDKGRLLQVLGDWCPPFPGYHLYYPSRRQQSPAFALLVEALRYRGSRKT